MFSDGQHLRAFIEKSRIRPIRIYQSMGISKQAFYKLYVTKEFEPSTIEKIEKAVGKKWGEIKSAKVDVNVDHKNVLKEPAPPKYQPEPDNIALITARNYEKLINTNSELAKAVLEQQKIKSEVEKKILEISAGTDLLQVLILNYHEFWIDQQQLPNGESLKRNLRKKVPLLLQKIKEADIVH